jgi:hypothetical protein
MDYIITTYPTLYRRYLVQNVNNEDEAWTKYYADLPEPIDEDYVDFVENDTEIELVTPYLKTLYGLEGE